MFVRKLVLAGVMTVMAGTSAMACGINARVSVVGNEFPAIQSVGAGAQECSGAEVTTNLTADHQKINVPGMQGNPAEYTSAIIANSSIVALMNEDVIRPLDDLVAKYGKHLKKNQLVTIDGKVMAVAFMANAQHLVYRADVLEQIGVEPPKTYEDMLTAAQMIRDKGIMPNPVGGAYKAGWNLAQEFNNMFLGMGGSHFKSGSAEPDLKWLPPMPRNILLNSWARFQPALYAPPTGFGMIPLSRIICAAAQMIRDKGIMPNPVGGAYKAGWNLAQEFNNMFLGMGGSHFKSGSAEPDLKWLPPMPRNILLNSWARFQPALYAPPTGFGMIPLSRIICAAVSMSS